MSEQTCTRVKISGSSTRAMENLQTLTQSSRGFNPILPLHSSIDDQHDEGMSPTGSIPAQIMNSTTEQAPRYWRLAPPSGPGFVTYLSAQQAAVVNQQNNVTPFVDISNNIVPGFDSALIKPDCMLPTEMSLRKWPPLYVSSHFPSSPVTLQGFNTLLHTDFYNVISPLYLGLNQAQSNVQNAFPAQWDVNQAQTNAQNSFRAQWVVNPAQSIVQSLNPAQSFVNQTQSNVQSYPAQWFVNKAQTNVQSYPAQWFVNQAQTNVQSYPAHLVVNQAQSNVQSFLAHLVVNQTQSNVPSVQSDFFHSYPSLNNAIALQVQPSVWKDEALSRLYDFPWNSYDSSTVFTPQITQTRYERKALEPRSWRRRYRRPCNLSQCQVCSNRLWW